MNIPAIAYTRVRFQICGSEVFIISPLLARNCLREPTSSPVRLHRKSPCSNPNLDKVGTETWTWRGSGVNEHTS
jgi:hypothetical protein